MLNTLRRTSRYEHNIITNEMVYEVNIVLGVEGIRNGFIQVLGGPTNFAVLMAIVAHTNENGESFPSQETIANEIGVSAKTVRTALAELEQVSFDGHKVLVREYREPTLKGKFKSSLYTVNPIVKVSDDVEVDDTVVAPKEKRMSSKDVIIYFVNEYEETFDEKYVPAWGRDGKLVKTKLLDVLDDDTIKAIIHTSVTEYTKRWGNKAYPRPSISMVCGWLGNSAQAIVAEKKKEETKFTENASWDFEEQQRIADKYL